jgi:hypothetical protein
MLYAGRAWNFAARENQKRGGNPFSLPDSRQGVRKPALPVGDGCGCACGLRPLWRRHGLLDVVLG